MENIPCAITRRAMAIVTAGRGVAFCTATSGPLAGDSPHQPSATPSAPTPARPVHAAQRPNSSNTGTSVPDSRMAMPTPVKATPVALPSRSGGTEVVTSPRLRIIITATVAPTRNRHQASQTKPKGAMLAIRHTSEISKAAFSTRTVWMRRASIGTPSAPARYPPRLKAPT